MWDLIAGTTTWSIFFLILQLNKKRSSEWNSRICALIHAFVGCRWIEYHFEWPVQYELFSSPNTWWHQILFTFTCSYFIFDLVYCLWAQSEEHYMILHHILGIWMSYYGYHYNVSGYEGAIGFWIAELANPFMQIRWFLRSVDLHGSIWYAASEMSFVIIFMINRVGIASWYTYAVLFLANCNIFVKTAIIAVHLFNIFFAWQIIGLVRKRLRGGTKKEVKQEVVGETADTKKVE